MQKLRLLFVSIALIWGVSSYAQDYVNTGSPTVPFGSKTSYGNGIMPTNLPTGGTYVRSQVAADQYNYWVKQFVEQCSDGSYRVKFDNTAQTVSEGIGYGMLLSAYAGDKVRFDGFWKFFLKSKNANGLMNWMTDGCNGNARDNAATDADLDAALALIIASKQWPNSTSPYTYKNEAVTLLGNIKRSEMDQNNKNTLNGDMWFDNNKLNPSYQSPAYYVEYAKIDVANKDFWNGAAIAASNLLKLNRNATTGLVSNWCHADGSRYADKTPDEYGADACRNPWRMTTDVLWHGTNATASSKEITTLLSNWLKGYESTLKGPMQPNAANPGVGTYANGTYTTFALAPMAMGSTYQASLNSCYTNIAGMGHDNVYFNETIRTITLFTLTGNFWAPDAAGLITAPEILSAESSEDGTKVTVVFTKDITAPSASESASFKLSINGAVSNSAITAIITKGTDAVVLTIAAGVIQAGQKLTLAYTAGTIKSTDNGSLASVTGVTVKNNIAGNSTMLDDCEDGNGVNQMGGAWFTYDDHKAVDAGVIYPGASIVTPLTTAAAPFAMVAGGADATTKSAKTSYTLNVGQWKYQPFIGLGITLNPEGTKQDLSSSTGLSFWYKGSPCRFQVKLDGLNSGADYGIAIAPKDAAVWELFSFSWSQLTQPSWANNNKPLAWGVDSAKKITQLAWHVQGVDKADVSSGSFYVDQVQIEGLVPTKLVSFVTKPTTLILDTKVLNADTATVKITYTPLNATYKEVIWSSSNPLVATVDQGGLVRGLTSGKVNITATSKFDATIVSTCVVTVKGAEILPESVTIATPTTTTLAINEKVQLSASIAPTTVTDKTILWTSSDPLIASVDATGLVTGRGAGQVIITAASQADNTIKSTVAIKVEVKAVLVTEILIDATKSLYVNETYTFTPTVNPTTATNKALTWSSSDDTKVSVTAAGKITAVANGSAIITAKAADGSLVTATCTVTVTTKVVLADGVTLDKSTMTLDAGKTGTLVATVSPVGTVSNSNVTWKSADETIATVSSTGVVTAKAKGDVEITATAADGSGFKATCLVTVKAVTTVDLVSSITIKEGDLSLVRLATKTLTPEVLPATAVQAVTWKSNDETVVTVDAAGKITAIKVGSAIITASATDASSKTGSITVTVTPILVASVTNADVTKTIQIGKTATLTTTVLPGNADNQSVVWSSSDDAKVSVNAVTGEITGVALGSATITATAKDASGKYSSTLVTVTSDAKPVTSVKIDLAALDLKTGATGKLTTTVEPSEATNSSVIWQSSNTAVAIVDQSGNVKAVGAGTAVIKVVSMENTSLSASSTVTVADEKVSGVTVVAPQVSLKVGELSVIEANVAPTTATNTALTYATSNASIAKVSSTGVITAVGAGDATITVTAADGSGKTASVAVNVTGAGTVAVLISKISLDKTTASVKVNSTVTVNVNYVYPDATNKAVLWTSSDESIATVANGVITGVKVGTATILASSADEGNAVSTVLVTVTTDATLVSSITSTTTSVSLVKGTNQTIVATVNPSNASVSTLNWTSSDETVATVSSTGVITAKKAGQVIVTATATDGSGKTLIIPVNVTEPASTTLATGVDITAVSKLKVLDVVTLSTVVYPNPGASQSVTYISSNEAVVSVSADGLVTAKSAGIATITAIAKDASGSKGTVTITVDATQVLPSKITATVAKPTLAIGEVTFYTVTIDPSNATVGTYKVTSSAPSIVEVVAGNKAIKALAAGTAVLTFVADANSGVTQEVTITVTAPVVVPVNKASLSAAIFTATDLIRINGSSKNASVAEYVYKLNTALASAKIVQNDAAATQAEVDAATKSLLDAINKLNTAVIKTDVTEEGVIATAVYPNPASGNITIVGSKVISSVSAVSYGGLSTVLATGVNATSAELSVAGLATATYSLVIVYTDGTSKVLALSVK